MNFLPIGLGLTTALCWGSADYLSRRQSESVGHYKTVLYSQLSTLLFLSLILAALRPATALPAIPVAVLLIAGATNFFAFLFLYRAFHRGVVSVVAPIAYTYPAVTTLVSVILLLSSLTASSALGIGAVIAGVVLLSTRFSELRGIRRGASVNLTAGLGTAVASSVLFGLVYVGVGYATPYVGFGLPPLVLRIIGAAVAIVLAPLFHQSIRPSRSAFSNTILVMGVLESIGFLAFSYGITLGGGALPTVAAISGMGGAVAAGYAMVYLKERLEFNQFIGLLVSAAGVFVLLYLG